MAIARAVYSQAETVILDDCLSAVDAHTARHIYENCLIGELSKFIYIYIQNWEKKKKGGGKQVKNVSNKIVWFIL